MFAFDVSRPVAGKTISPQLPALFESEGFSLAWRRADWAGEFGEHVSSATEYALAAEPFIFYFD